MAFSPRARVVWYAGHLFNRMEFELPGPDSAMAYDLTEDGFFVLIAKGETAKMLMELASKELVRREPKSE